MPITSASATSARATIAPDYLLRQHVRIGRRAPLDLTGYPGSGGHVQDTRLNSNTHGHVLCVAIEFHVLAMACTSRVAGEVLDLYAPRARSRRGADAMPSQEGRRSPVLLYWPRGI